MEGRQKASDKSAVYSGASCAAGESDNNYASQRWSLFLRKTIKGAAPAVLTARRIDGQASLVFEVAPSSAELPSGFGSDDLPQGMRQVVERLREGDAVSYRLEARGKEFFISPVGDFPSYLTGQAEEPSGL